MKDFIIMKSNVVGKLCNFLQLPDRLFVRILYFFEFGKLLHLSSPQTFTEKVNFLKVTQTDQIFSDLADKYKVRKYVSEKIGMHVLPILYWHGFDPEDIPFDALPSTFVIKCNHGCGFNILVEDKSRLDVKETIHTLKGWLKKDFYKMWRELQYKNIEKQIIVEEFLQDSTQDSLVDYKIFCFNGTPVFMQVDLSRHTWHKRFMCDTDGNRLDFTIGRMPVYKWAFTFPDNLCEMFVYAQALSEGFPLVRVDLYNVNQKIYFWELTFSPGNWLSHFYPDHAHFDAKIGRMIALIV